MAVADELLLVVRANTTQAIAGLSAVEAKTVAFGAKVSATMAAAGASITKGLTLPLIAIAGFGIKSFADFDSAMTESLAIMGDAAQAWRGEMEAAAREVAKTTTLTAEEAAASYFYLASAGMDAEQSIAALPAVARFAQAGMFDMSTATSLAADAQSALGLKVDDTQENLANLVHVTDILVRSNTLANASVQEFSEAMTSGAAATSRSFGMELEETAAVLGLMADRGIKGAEAGTQFTMALNNMTANAVRNADAFKEQGIAVFDAQGELRNMADIVDDMTVAFGALSDEEQVAAMMNLGFGDRAAKTLKTMLGGADAIREYEDALRDSSGFTEDVASRQLESFSARWTLLKHKIADVGLSIGKALLPPLTDLVEKIGPFVTKLGEWVEANQELTMKTMAFAAAIGPVLLLVSKLFKIVTLLSSPIGIIVLAIGATILILDKLGVSLSDVVEFFRPVLDIVIALGRYLGFVATEGDTANDWLTHLPEPLQAVALALGEFIETMKVWAEAIWENLKKVVQFFQDHWEEIREILEKILAVFMDIWTDIWDFLGPFIEEMVAFVSRLFGELIEWFDENFYLIKDTIVQVLDILKAIWDIYWPAIQAVFEAVWNALAPLVETAFNLVLDVIKLLMAVFTGDWGAAWDAVKGIVTGVWDGIKGIVRGAFDVLGAILSIGMGLIKRIWSKVWNFVKSIVTGIWDGIKGVVQGGVNAAIGALETLVNASAKMLNHIIQMWNNANLFLNFADIPKVPTDTVFPRVNLGDGGTVGRGGAIATLGERGRPETAFLPGGTQVSSGQGGSGALIGQLVVNSDADPISIAREMGWELMRRG